MITTNVNKSQLLQHIFMLVGLYQDIQMQFILFIFTLLIISLTLGLMHQKITLHVIHWYFKLRQKISFLIIKVRNPNSEDFRVKYQTMLSYIGR